MGLHLRAPDAPRHRWALVLAAVAVIAAVGATVALTRDGGGSTGPSAEGGALAAPLQLRGSDRISGKVVSLANYPGEPIVLNMWASWCTGCYAEARALATFERSHPHVQGLPATLFLDRRHRVVAKILGETTLAGFDAGYRRAQT